VTAALLLTVIVSGGYFRSKAEREGGPMQSDEGQGLVAALRLLGLIVMLPVLGYIVSPEWVAALRFSLPDEVRWIGALVAGGTIPIFIWILVSIGSNITPTQATRKTHKLVTHGPYRWVRHPLYATGFLFGIALGVLTALWWLPVGMIPVFAALLLRTPLEEARLIERFGDQYRDYMKRTGRFFPKIL
jgi:protein-S-isoprenylcysteine O-methyltransferase Ste14